MIDCTLDSTAVIDAIRGSRTVHTLPTHFTAPGICHVTLGELLLGAFKTGDRNELRKTTRVISGMTLLHGDSMTAIIYARIRRDLELRGALIPQNDIWIAAASIQAEVPLVTRDRHFNRIQGLRIASY